MRIKEVAFENFRGFKGAHSVEMPEGNITVVIGTNGAGKTSFLDGIAILLEELSMQLLLSTQPLIFTLQENDISQNNEQNCLISINIEIDKIIRHLKREFGDKTYSLLSPYNITKYISRIHNDREELPIGIYYQTQRNFIINKENSTSEKLWNEILSYGFSPKINFGLIIDWYINKTNIQNNEKVKRKNLDYELPVLAAVSKALDSYLQKMLESDIEINLSQDIDDSQILIIKKNNTQLDFFQLSAGERMTLGIVLDIAHKMAVANPQLDNPLLTHGIVLIDEIELHLHPKWQMSVLDALSNTFPNVQFIVTTHSPLVINHVSNEQLIILDDFKIISGKEVHNTYGRDVNTIIEDFMGGMERPVTIKKQIKKIEDALDAEKPNLKKARKYLEELKQKIDPNDYELLKLDTLITIEEADEVYQKTS